MDKTKRALEDLVREALALGIAEGWSRAAKAARYLLVREGHPDLAELVDTELTRANEEADERRKGATP